MRYNKVGRAMDQPVEVPPARRPKSAQALAFAMPHRARRRRR